MRLKYQTLIALLMLLTVGCALASVSDNFESGTPTASMTVQATHSAEPSLTASPLPDEQEVLARINKLRASLGLTLYSYNHVLSLAAQNQAQWMVSTGSVMHIRPDGSTPALRAAAAGYAESWTCSEIIYMGGIATVDYAWEFWLNSKIHYAEITSSLHREAGIGTAHSDEFGQAFVVVFGGFTLPTAAAAPPGAYIVQPGDTLYLIAQRYGVSMQALAAANHIGVNDTIFIGQVLVFPQSATQEATLAAPVTSSPTLVPTSTPTLVQPLVPSPGQSPTPIYHVVQPGETLFLITQRYGVPLDQVIAANGIANPDRIEVGQVIIIPSRSP
jgi:LysM repeat protein